MDQVVTSQALSLHLDAASRKWATNWVRFIMLSLMPTQVVFCLETFSTFITYKCSSVSVHKTMSLQGTFWITLFPAFFAAGIDFIGVVDFNMLGKLQKRDKSLSTGLTEIGPLCVLVQLVVLQTFKFQPTFFAWMTYIHVLSENWKWAETAPTCFTQMVFFCHCVVAKFVTVQVSCFYSAFTARNSLRIRWFTAYFRINVFWFEYFRRFKYVT